MKCVAKYRVGGVILLDRGWLEQALHLINVLL